MMILLSWYLECKPQIHFLYDVYSKNRKKMGYFILVVISDWPQNDRHNRNNNFFFVDMPRYDKKFKVSKFEAF